MTRAIVTPLTIAQQTVRPDVPPDVGLFYILQIGENMARIEKQTAVRQKAFTAALPFTKLNYQILGTGLLSIVLGYIALAQEPWDGTMPLVVAPILLVLGYCVLIPVGILAHKRPSTDGTAQQIEQQPQ
jgi:hypothetical protein